MLELGPEPLDGHVRQPERGGQCGEVRGEEVDSERLLADQLLVEAEHAVAAVVDQHDRERDPLLDDGGQLATRVHEPAVAAHADGRAGAGQRGAQRRGESEPERPPAERIAELARCGNSPVPAQPVAGDAHVDHHHGVGRQRSLHDLEEVRGARLVLAHPRRDLGIDLRQAPLELGKTRSLTDAR